MATLDPKAVEQLWPILQVLGAILGALVFIAGTLAAGFRWLNRQIKSTAQQLVEPVAAKSAQAERTARAAHRRLDLVERHLRKQGYDPDPYVPPDDGAGPAPA